MNRQRGFNLIELSIALSLGAVLIVGLGTVFSGVHRAHQTQSAIRDIHFGGVHGLDLLSREIRLAGHTGCIKSFRDIRNIPDTDTAPNYAVWGIYEDGDDSDYNIASDRLRIRYLEPLWKNIDERLQLELTGFDEAGNITTNRRANENPELNRNDPLVLMDCRNADYFLLDSRGYATKSITPQSAITTTRYPIAGPAPPAILYRHRYIEYSVQRDRDGDYNLFRQPLELNTAGNNIRKDPLIRDVKKLEVRYGADTGDGPAPDEYKTAAEVGADEWDTIRSLRLILHFFDSRSDSASPRNLCGGVEQTPEICSFRTTLLLRNRL